MSQHQSFKRMAVPQQLATPMQVITLPAPLRGIHLDENQSFMQPGGAVVLDNWLPTLRGVKLRGGSKIWATLPEAEPIVSSFEYQSSNIHRMYACNSTKVYDVSAGGTPTLVKSGQHSGNYAASQLANQGGDWMIVVNDAGDFPLRYNGTSWVTLDGTPPATWGNGVSYAVGARAMDATDRTYWKNTFSHTSAAAGTFAADRAAHPTYWVTDVASDGVSWIVGPPGTSVVGGHNLVYVWKYRNRLFFIEGGSMNAYYLNTNAVGGTLQLIPLSGAASKGGHLLWGSTWSMDAGDGLDDKCVFCSSEGELLVFTGTNPSDAANWRQEGRFQLAHPMGMNGHLQVGGELLVITADGIVPVSQAITKDIAALQMSAITRPIAQLWQAEVADKDDQSWTMRKWDRFGALFVTLPGGTPGEYRCFVANTNTTAWCRITGWDAMCWMMLNENMFFGTQKGVVMQADFGGYDDTLPYTATMVGSWEMFQQPAAQVTWLQARAIFAAQINEPLQPQISACTDMVVSIPPAPNAALDTSGNEFWDGGLWDSAHWDAVPFPQSPPLRNTMWVSVGRTGFSHAPVLQITTAQTVKPNVELISIAATYTTMGVNV